MNQTDSLSILYPESDGKPLAENTKQLEWIVRLFGNIRALYIDRDDVFVAADLMWYHEEDNPGEALAPDVMVVFDRPKKHRTTYLQWDENDTPAQIVFEIRSPSNDDQEMTDKLQDYDDWGVQEYYVYDPDRNILQVYTRGRQTLRSVTPLTEFISPKMGVRFVLTKTALEVFHPDGTPFHMMEEWRDELLLEREMRRSAEETARREIQKRIAAEEKQAEAEQQRAEAERKQSEAEQQRAEAEQRFARYFELSRKSRLGQATAEELAELERLDQDS